MGTNIYIYIWYTCIYIYNPLQICHQDPGDAFDFLDVRSCGTISLREVGVKWMVQLMFCAVWFEKRQLSSFFEDVSYLLRYLHHVFRRCSKRLRVFECFLAGHQKDSGNACSREFQPSALNHTSKEAYYYMQPGDEPFRCFNGYIFFVQAPSAISRERHQQKDMGWWKERVHSSYTHWRGVHHSGCIKSSEFKLLIYMNPVAIQCLTTYRSFWRRHTRNTPPAPMSTFARWLQHCKMWCLERRRLQRFMQGNCFFNVFFREGFVNFCSG